MTFNVCNVFVLKRLRVARMNNTEFISNCFLLRKAEIGILLNFHCWYAMFIRSFYVFSEYFQKSFSKNSNYVLRIFPYVFTTHNYYFCTEIIPVHSRFTSLWWFRRLVNHNYFRNNARCRHSRHRTLAYDRNSATNQSHKFRPM